MSSFILAGDVNYSNRHSLWWSKEKKTILKAIG